MIWLKDKLQKDFEKMVWPKARITYVALILDEINNFVDILNIQNK